MDETAGKQARITGTSSPVLNWLKGKFLPQLQSPVVPWRRDWAGLYPYLEVSAVVLWAAWFGRGLLDLNPNLWPAGGEFAMGIQSNYIWTLLGRCGACVFWNGFTQGGVPAFVDLHGAPLHPLVIVTTLIWGPVNGAKITVVSSLALAGLAQWWLARRLGLGLVARLWSGGLAVVAGHVAGRLEIGLVPLVISAASACLVIAAALDLALAPSRRSAVRLGLLLGLALLSGQGYFQAGLGLSLAPALLVLLMNRQWRLAPAWREFAAAGVIGLLVAAVLLVPVVRFAPHLDKFTDPAFEAAQPAAYAPLNLVIGDPAFFYTDSLDKQTYPYLYANYIGWAPVLLALAALYFVPKDKARLLAFFVVGIILAYLASGAITLRLLALVVPGLAQGLRNPSIIAALAVPLVLALAAWAIDRLLRLEWPRLTLSLASSAVPGPTLVLPTVWLLLAPVLIWSLASAYRTNRTWLRTAERHPGVPQVIGAMAELVPPGQSQWVQPPWGEHFWLPDALALNLKLADYYRPWKWRGSALPEPYVLGIRDPDAATWPGYYATVDSVNIVLQSDRTYAFVETPAGKVPCAAAAQGGNIDVTCETTEPGRLVVREHWLSGWGVTLDGEGAALAAGDWLTVPAPAGSHAYQFRYRPWDVTLGLLLTLTGLGLSVYWWRRSGPVSPRPVSKARAASAAAPPVGPAATT